LSAYQSTLDIVCTLTTQFTVHKYYEYCGSHVQSSRYYYYFGDQRIAMRRGEANVRNSDISPLNSNLKSPLINS